MTQLSDEKYRELCGLITDALYPLSATSTLPVYCDRLNLPATNLIAFDSKRKYINARLTGIDADELLTVGEKVKRDYPTSNMMLFFHGINQNPQSITDITRKDIFDAIRLNNVWYAGNCSELEFLKRVFNLENISSKDPRFKTFEGDLIQHTVNNNDWDDYWIFSDSRFNLLHIPDDIFAKFLCEMLHPIVNPNQENVQNLLHLFNQYLKNDGWEIYEHNKISSKPIFKARKIGVVIKIKEIPFGEEYIKEQILRMEENIEKSPDLAIGTAKELIETTLKTITNTTDRKADIPSIQKQALKSLNLVPDCIPDSVKGAEIIKILLSNFSTIVQKVDELRNLYGTGHGKHAKTTKLEPRHARLAVGAAITFVNFVFETYKKQQNK